MGRGSGGGGGGVCSVSLYLLGPPPAVAHPPSRSPSEWFVWPPLFMVAIHSQMYVTAPSFQIAERMVCLSTTFHGGDPFTNVRDRTLLPDRRANGLFVHHFSWWRSIHKCT